MILLEKLKLIFILLCLGVKLTIFVEASDLYVLSFAIWIECRVEFTHFSFNRACYVLANN